MALMRLRASLNRPAWRGSKQIRVGLVFVAADAAAQLIEIAQAEAIGAIDDDGVRVRDVDAAFDDRGGKQDVGFAVDEFGHHFFEFVGVHLAVADARCARAARASCKLLRDSVDVEDAIVQIENLAAAIEFALDGVADDALVILRDDGFDGQTILRRRFDGAHVARAGRAPDRACAESAWR